MADYNKQDVLLQRLEKLANDYIAEKKISDSKRDQYYKYLVILFKNGYSKNFLARYLSETTGKKVSVQYIARLINSKISEGVYVI